MDKHLFRRIASGLFTFVLLSCANLASMPTAAVPSDQGAQAPLSTATASTTGPLLSSPTAPSPTPWEHPNSVVPTDTEYGGPEDHGAVLQDPRPFEAAAMGYADAVDSHFHDRNTPTPTPIKQPLSSSSAVIWQGPPGKSQVALTFDAGAGAKPTLKILAILKAYEVKGTMFLTGQWARDNPDLVRQMVADGHELANHSYSHPHLSQMARSQIEEELRQAQRHLEAISGMAMAPYFRPPFGEQTQDIREVAASVGYQTIYWTLDSGDWLDGATAALVRKRVLNGVSDGAIIVMHLGSQATADALEDVLKGLQEKELHPVSLSQLLAP